MALPRKWSRAEITASVRQHADDAATAAVMLAVIEVESGFNQYAVGDNGTSFGLFQHHVGGALGSHSREWAFDPANVIPERARAFAGARTGADAARVQRPADPVGYAKKIDRILGSSTTTRAVSSAPAKRKKWSPLIPEIDKLAQAHGLSVTSANRVTKYTSDGNVSDHYRGKPETWARDYSKGGADRTAKLVAFQRAVESQYGSQLRQVLGPTNRPSDHSDHVHVAGDSLGYGATVTGSGSITPKVVGGDGGLLGLDGGGAAGTVLRGVSGIVFTAMLLALAGGLIYVGIGRALGVNLPTPGAGSLPLPGPLGAVAKAVT